MMVGHGKLRGQWAAFAAGIGLVMLGGLYLVAVMVLPHLLVTAEGAQGIGIYDPELGGDPLLALPLPWGRMTVAAVLVVAGAAIIRAARRGRRSEPAGPTGR
jgi:hypothetical protein